MIPNKTKPIRIILRICTATIIVLLALLLAFNAALLVKRAVKHQPIVTIFGVSSAVVVSDSMRGALNRHDLILIHSKGQYATGDIVTYVDSRGSVVTHRVVSVLQSGYETKGDANTATDGIIVPSQIVGKVVAIIPAVGYVFGFFATPIGLLSVIIAVALFYVLSAYRVRRNGRSKADGADG